MHEMKASCITIWNSQPEMKTLCSEDRSVPPTAFTLTSQPGRRYIASSHAYTEFPEFPSSLFPSRGPCLAQFTRFSTPPSPPLTPLHARHHLPLPGQFQILARLERRYPRLSPLGDHITTPRLSPPSCLQCPRRSQRPLPARPTKSSPRLRPVAPPQHSCPARSCKIYGQP